MSLYFFQILRLKAVLSPILRHTGLMSRTCSISSLIPLILPGVSVDPTLSLRISPRVTLWILCCLSLLSPEEAPSSRFSWQNFTVISWQMAGRLPGMPSTLPTSLSLRVKEGSMSSPTPMSPPGTAQSRLLFSASSEITRDRIGLHETLPDSSLVTMPGLISMTSPTCSTPWMMEPPTTPPLRSSMGVEGRFTSKERMMMSWGGTARLRVGTGMKSQMALQMTSMLYLKIAETGRMGDREHRVSLMKDFICSQFSFIFLGLFETRSTLFWIIIMLSSFIIYTATRCYEVCGWGQSMFAAISRNALSITAAPVNIVDNRMSWPGQSTKETCLTNCSSASHSLLVHLGRSSCALEKDLNASGPVHLVHLQILALAYPSRIVIFLTFYCLKRIVCTPDIALTTVLLPWATWPMVPMLTVACREMT